MANSFSGITAAEIAQLTLAGVVTKLPILNVIATDLSADIAQGGSSVSTRVATVATASLFSAGNAADSNSTAEYAITLNSDAVGVTVALTDYEVSTSKLADLQRIFIGPVVNAITKKVNNDVLALVTGSIHSSSYSGSIANFDTDEISDSIADLELYSYTPENVVLAPSLANVVRKSLATYTVLGSDQVLRTGEIGKVFGQNVWTTNGTFKNNILGFICGKNALIMASRTMKTPANFPGSIEVVTDPASGLTLEFRQWYDATNRKNYMSMGILYGVARGVPEALRTYIAA